jgi:hypothetical protein
MMISARSICRHSSVRTAVVARSFSTAPPQPEDPFWPLISAPKRHWAKFGRSIYQESPEYKKKRLSMELWATKNRISHLQEWVEQGLTAAPPKKALDDKFLENGSCALPKTYYKWLDGSHEHDHMSLEEQIQLMVEKGAKLEDELGSK